MEIWTHPEVILIWMGECNTILSAYTQNSPWREFSLTQLLGIDFVQESYCDKERVLSHNNCYIVVRKCFEFGLV